MDCLQTGEISAEAGAGAFFEARRLELSCLWRLLHAHVLPGPHTPLDLHRAIQRFNFELLTVQHDGHFALLHHLITLLKVSPTSPSKMPLHSPRCAELCLQ